MSDANIQTCGSCGASVYPEHVASGKAAEMEGKLLCPLCLADYKRTHHVDETRYTGQSSMRAPGESEAGSIAIDPSALTSAGSTQVRAFGQDTLAGASVYDDSEYKRPLLGPNEGATRCRTFHAKLNDGAVGFMNRQICEWADSNPDIVIKFASTTMGVWEGKKSDPTLIVTVFY